MDVNALLLEIANSGNRGRGTQSAGARQKQPAYNNGNQRQERGKRDLRAGRDVVAGDAKYDEIGVQQRRKSKAESRPPVHRYRDGTAYRKPNPRRPDSDRRLEIDDCRNWRREMTIADLGDPKLDWRSFHKSVMRELKLMGYSSRTRVSYEGVLRSFVRWAGRLPSQITREHIREYLEYLIDGKQASLTVSVHLSALRTMLDKFCNVDLTLGISCPRRPKRLPVVLSKQEVERLLTSAVSLRDKLLLGLMYACGLRVSELARLRWRDVDIDRNMITVFQGKGNADRQVSLPQSYRVLFTKMKSQSTGEFLFPSESRNNRERHISPRTIQRAMKTACRLAKITKRATPHSLRHSFATHSFEDGCDIRRIQKSLGHVNLETTKIYLKTAKPKLDEELPSPLDTLMADSVGASGEMDRFWKRTRIHERQMSGESFSRLTIEVKKHGERVFFTGVRVREVRPNFWSLELPLLEDWSEPAGSLGSADRALMESPEFYERLQHELAVLKRGTKVSRHRHVVGLGEQAMAGNRKVAC